MKTIEEGNKLIAEFMQAKNEISDVYYLPEFGHYFNSYGQIEWNECFRSNELKYHTSWDWLMPVAEKIEKTWRGEDLFCVKIAFNTCLITQERLMDKPIVRAESTNRIDRTKIEAVWSAVVNFIEWYNNN